jgi:hypothetical protein
VKELRGLPRLDADRLRQVQFDDIASWGIIGTSQRTFNRRESAGMVDE